MVIQKARTQRDPQAQWFMAPSRLGRNFQAPSSTAINQKAAYPQSNLSPVGRPVVFTYYELTNLPVYRLCLCILACFPCYQNLFDLVSSLCSFSLNHIISSLIVSIRINKIDTVTSGCLWGI